jgi:hypothetical protein
MVKWERFDSKRLWSTGSTFAAGVLGNRRRAQRDLMRTACVLCPGFEWSASPVQVYNVTCFRLLKISVAKIRGSQIFQKCKISLKFLGARRVIRSRLHTEGPQMLGATGQDIVAGSLCTPGQDIGPALGE